MPAYKAAETAYTRIFGKRPLPVRRGGSIGVIAIFEKVLGVKSILMGFGLESDAILIRSTQMLGITGGF